MKWIKVALSIGVHYLYVIRWRYFVGSEKAALKLLKELGAAIIVTIKDDGTNSRLVYKWTRAHARPSK